MSPQLVVGANGNVTVIWLSGGGANSLKSVTKAGDALTWGVQQDVSVLGQDAAEPRLRVDPLGNAMVIFRRSNGTNTVIQSAIRLAGVDAWSSPQTVSAPLQNAGSPDLAFDALGTATAVWRRFDGVNFIAQTATRSGTAWGPPQDLSAPGRDAAAPRVGVDDAGNAVAVWQRADDANLIRVQVAERPASTGTWGPARDLSGPGGNASDPVVVVESNGNATVLWLRADASGSTVQTTYRPVGGDWTEPQALSRAGTNADQVAVVANPGGGVTAVWRAGGHIQTAGMAATGAWGPVQDLSPPAAPAAEPAVAINAAGETAVTWRTDGSPSTIQLVTRSPGGGWSAPRGVSPGARTADAAQVGLDGSGNGAVTWLESDGANPVVHVAGLDATGPTLLGVVVPPEGNAGEPVEMLAAAFDVWSGPATPPAWTFGNGRTGTGDFVAPIFPRPGRYSVTVRSRDTAGVETSTQRFITIKPLTVRRLKLSCDSPAADGICPVRSRFQLSHSATVTFTIRNAKGRVVGKVTRKAEGGPNDFGLPRKLGRRPWAAGRYRVVVQARVGGARSATRSAVVAVR